MAVEGVALELGQHVDLQWGEGTVGWQKQAQMCGTRKTIKAHFTTSSITSHLVDARGEAVVERHLQVEQGDREVSAAAAAASGSRSPDARTDRRMQTMHRRQVVPQPPPLPQHTHTARPLTSIIRSVEPSGTAGIARYLDSGFWVSPPARTTARTVCAISSRDSTGSFLQGGQRIGVGKSGAGAGKSGTPSPSLPLW